MLEFQVTEHVGSSILYMSNGTLKVLYNVRPPSNNVAAIPLDEVASTIFPFDLIFARIKFCK